MSLAELLKEIADDTKEAKDIKDAKGIPLVGQDLADFTELVNNAKGNCGGAQADDWFDGITPAELPQSQPCWIDDFAGYDLEDLHETGEKQACMDRLKTINLQADAAIAEVS